MTPDQYQAWWTAWTLRVGGAAVLVVLIVLACAWFLGPGIIAKGIALSRGGR